MKTRNLAMVLAMCLLFCTACGREIDEIGMTVPSDEAGMELIGETESPETKPEEKTEPESKAGTEMGTEPKTEPESEPEEKPETKGGITREVFDELLALTVQESPKLLRLNCLDGMERKDWFLEYSGEKVQRVPGFQGDNYRYAECYDTIYYRADEGETLEQIIGAMKEALMEPLTIPNEDRSYTVTKYDVSAQQVLTRAESWELFSDAVWASWEAYYPEDSERQVMDLLKTIIKELSPYTHEGANLDFFVEEDMWVLPKLDGYYAYTGEDGVTMEQQLEKDWVEEVDGMISFFTSRGDYSAPFILMCYQDVYRLQRVFPMQIYAWELKDDRNEGLIPGPDAEEPEEDTKPVETPEATDPAEYCITREQSDKLLEQLLTESPKLLRSENFVQIERGEWFAEYNGEKLHRVVREEDAHYSFVTCDDIVFYRADEGETLEQIIAAMKTALIEPLTLPGQGRYYQILKYDVSEQRQIYSAAEVDQMQREQFWDRVKRLNKNCEEETVLRTMRQELPYLYFDRFELIMPEDTWLLPFLTAKARYVGSMSVTNMEWEQQFDGVVEDMVYLSGQGSDSQFQYLLMKQGNVYRLQRLNEMMGDARDMVERRQ